MRVPVQVLATLVLTQLLSNVPGMGTENNPNTWNPATHVADQDGALNSIGLALVWIWHGSDLAFVAT